MFLEASAAVDLSFAASRKYVDVFFETCFNAASDFSVFPTLETLCTPEQKVFD